MLPFWKGALTGTLVSAVVAGAVTWALSIKDEPPPLVETQILSSTWPGGPSTQAKLRPILAIAFPIGSKVSALRFELGKSGFVVDSAKHNAKFSTGGFVCRTDFNVSWEEAAGDRLTAIDGEFVSVCL